MLEFRAGADHVIAALWPIRRDSVPALVEALHRLVGSGVHPAETLRRTLQDHRHKPLWEWASLTHIGLP